MNVRRVDVFFYGLFMDEAVLRESGAEPVNPRPAHVTDFALRIGQRATLVPSNGARSYGMLISLAHGDLQRLYSAPGLEGYRPEAVLAHTADATTHAALCYNLVEAPRAEERNPQYATRLRELLRTLGFPAEYVASIS